MKNLPCFLVFLAACTASQEKVSQKLVSTNDVEANKPYRLVLGEGYLYVEEFDSSMTDENRYNQNNVIFTLGSSFRYTYQYVDSTGKQFYFRDVNDGWQLVPVGKADAQTIKEVLIQVEPGLGGNDKQTIISYHYADDLSYSTSGVIENEKNVWMHPPRDGLFRVLELNPFPYIKKPYEIGNRWQWKLDIGSHWADKRWKVWEGRITNEYDYEITGKKEISTRMGVLVCHEITSTAQSRIGKTALLAYFNEKHGFVRLDYTNIDGSRLNMELVDRK